MWCCVCIDVCCVCLCVVTRYACTKATVVSFFMTFFEIFDVPVYWPILLLYFISLFLLTMKRQIKHMIKHRYAPHPARCV